MVLCPRELEFPNGSYPHVLIAYTDEVSLRDTLRKKASFVNLLNDTCALGYMAWEKQKTLGYITADCDA